MQSSICRTGRSDQEKQKSSAVNTGLSRQTIGVNTIMVARKPQKANMTAPTRDKGRDLAVEDITATYAFVVGTNDTYEVSFRSLTCNCPAGQRGLHCSHVAAAVAERARMHGFDHVMLGRTQDHAESFAALQRAKGKRTHVRVEAGWYIVEYGQLVVAAAAPKRSHDAIQADVDRWF